MRFRLSMWRVLPAMLALFVLAGPVSLHAGIILPASTSTFLFSGVCQDCEGIATATLVLQDYTQGDPIAQSNLVSFHYNGTDLLDPFTITGSDQFNISGIIPLSLTASANFFIEALPDSVPWFSSDTEGGWSAGDLVIQADFGTGGVWNGPVSNAVPEPGVFLLVAAGMAVIGVRRWRVRN